MKVSGIAISTGPDEARLLDASLPPLRAQVDELVVVANGPGSVGDLPDGVHVIRNERRLGFSANINAGVEATSGEYVVVANPDAVAPESPVPRAVARSFW